MALISRGSRWGLGWRLLLLPLLLLGLVGCDPTEDAFSVSVVNDSAHSVTLRQCDATCQTVYYTETVAANASASFNASSENVDEFVSVTDASGNRLGCLNLKFQTRQAGARIPISSAKTCPQVGAAAASGSSWWSDALLFIYLAAVGIFGMVVMSFSFVRTYDRWRAKGRNPVVAGLAGAAMAVLMMMGGWLIVGVYLLVRWMRHHLAVEEGLAWLRR